MTKRKDPIAKEALSNNRKFHEDRNIPTIRVDIPMPKGAKPPKDSQRTNSSPNRSKKP